jgi:GDP-4-dehydro-6-deoxy-D-mannose reductase
MTMRSLVTGIDGFIGSWLAEALLAAGDTVIGLSRQEEGTRDGIHRFRGDVTDAARVHAIVEAARPDRVFHLAGRTNVMQSLAHPAETFAVNVNGTVHLFEALRRAAPSARVVSVGSSAEYGRTAAAFAPLTEEMPLLPSSPYGISKVAAGLLCPVYFKAHGLHTIHVRPFSVIGPRKDRDVLSDFCKGVVAIERGESAQLHHGTIDAERDFVDVRDAVRALVLLAEGGAAGEAYNLCGGRSATLAEVLGLLAADSKRPFSLVLDPSRVRPVDDLVIVGNASKLESLGYAPRHKLDETVRATLAYWREALRS